MMLIHKLFMIQFCNNFQEITYQQCTQTNTDKQMETTKASLVVMSHLSDVQEIIDNKLDMPLSISSSLNYVKYIIIHCKGDLNQEIDERELFSEFMKTVYYKG